MIAGTPGAMHRGEQIQELYKKEEDEDWIVRGVECVIVRTVGKVYWIVPVNYKDDDKFDDDGPYKTAKAAAVSAALQERTK